MIGAKIRVRREGRKIVYTYEFESEEIAKTTYNVIKQNPSFLGQFEQYKAIINGINFRREENKVIQTVEFNDEKSAECFYYLQSRIMGGSYGEEGRRT